MFRFISGKFIYFIETFSSIQKNKFRLSIFDDSKQRLYPSFEEMQNSSHAERLGSDTLPRRSAHNFENRYIYKSPKKTLRQNTSIKIRLCIHRKLTLLLYAEYVQTYDQSSYCECAFIKSSQAKRMFQLTRRVKLDPRILSRHCMKFKGSAVPALSSASLSLKK